MAERDTHTQLSPCVSSPLTLMLEFGGGFMQKYTDISVGFVRDYNVLSNSVKAITTTAN